MILLHSFFRAVVTDDSCVKIGTHQDAVCIAVMNLVFDSKRYVVFVLSLVNCCDKTGVMVFCSWCIIYCYYNLYMLDVNIVVLTQLLYNGC